MDQADSTHHWASGPPGILVKIAVSLFTGAVAFLLTNVTEQPKIWAVTLSTFVAGVVLVIQFLGDFDRRLRLMEAKQEARLDALDRQIPETFLKITEATQLFAAIEASMVRSGPVTELARNSGRILPETPALLVSYAQSEINRTARILKNIANETPVGLVGEDHTSLLALVDIAERTLDAFDCSVVDTGKVAFEDSFHWSLMGARYLKRQRAAIARGVTIRRAFAVPDSELLENRKLIDMCRAQRAAGVDVRLIPPEAIWDDELYDFVVFDEVLSYELPTARKIGKRTDIPETLLVLEGVKVGERVKEFDRYWEFGRPVDPA